MRFALSIAAVFLAASAARAATTLPVGEAPAVIPVVKTFAELKKTQSVSTGEDGEIRVGIQADACDTGDGLLVYVYEESGQKAEKKKNETEVSDGKTRTGPVFIEVRPVSEKDQQLLMDLQKSARQEQDEKFAPGLFVCPVQFHLPGKFEVRVLSAEDDVLASAIVTVGKKKAQAWFPIEVIGVLDPKDKEPHRALVEAIPAIPNWNSRHATEIAEDGTLPQLVPAESPEFQIEARAGDIDVVFKHAICNRPERQYLIRVWVNGKPVEAPRGFEGRGFASSGSSREMEPPVKFTLHPDLSALEGIVKTDKVEIQMAYSRAGYLTVFDRSPFVPHEERKGTTVLVSNKITLQEGRPADKTPAK